MFLNIKKTSKGQLLFQICGSGPWRNQYKTDSLMSVGEHKLHSRIADGPVGTWVQSVLGHELRFGYAFADAFAV